MSALWDARYHVPRSQVWEGSRGRQTGYIHLHVREQFDLGRIHRRPGEPLCGKSRGWYERTPEGEAVCPKCEAIRSRFQASCRHPDLRGTPFYMDGRKVWICETCDARVVHEDAEPVPASKLVPVGGAAIALPNGMPDDGGVGYGTF